MSAPTGKTALMCERKRLWWAGAWPQQSFLTPRVAVLMNAMITTARPSSPNQSIAHGYMSMTKFHDGEPALLAKAIALIDPDFWADYPFTGAKTQTLSAEIGEAARSFFRHGLYAFSTATPPSPEGGGRLGCLPQEPDSP